MKQASLLGIVLAFACILIACGSSHRSDCGQYDDRWAYIHMTPEEAVTAAKDLNASALLPSHIGRFTIARHPWDEPFQRITSACQRKSLMLLTPVVGAQIIIAGEEQSFSRWWEIK